MSGICKVHNYRDPDCQSCEEISPDEARLLAQEPETNGRPLLPYTREQLTAMYAYYDQWETRQRQYLSIRAEYMTGRARVE